ncbi:hypothetical protein CK203_046243 [Vitis vinifera]|uniref:DUF4283 domain-containing protein n=1 Tax=Vitis vinifera TaxID=29760 RepID=A0A438HDE7_VITVI|nr:hypothetical protein CK203_046243 [Vitis vinifera]
MSYATIAKRALLGNPNAIAVKVKREESMGLLKKLEHCVVASRRGNVGEEDDLEKLGQHWAKSWELKGSLGLAKMEKGRVLLDFEDLEEARRVVSSGNRTMEGVQPRDFEEGGDECGGFITADEQMKSLGELQWARILVRGRGDARPSVLEVEVEEEVYEIALWWECRPVIRRSSRQADGRCRSEVGGEESSRAEKRVTKGWVSVRLEDLHPSGDGTGPSCRPDEVGCSTIGPVSTSNKGLSSKGYGPQSVRSVNTREGPSSSSAGQDHNISQKKDLMLMGPDPGKTHAPEPFVAWETEDLRKLNGLGCVERSNGCREVGAKESSSDTGRGTLEVPGGSRLGRGPVYLSCRFRNIENGAIWIFTGVYGLFSKMEREALWDELGAIRGLWEDPWCIGGDFNITLFPREGAARGE